MLRKLTVIAAILAALAIPGAAMAGKHGGGHGHWKGGHGHWKGGHGHYNKRWYGHGYKNYGWRGHGRYWGGRWYAYGVGSCWRLVPGGWVWVCN